MKLITFWSLFILAVGCAPRTTVGTLFSSLSPHERYEKSLQEAKLDQTALGKNWLKASQQSLQDSLVITLPFREVGYFAAERPRAFAFRYPVRVGQVIHITLRPSSPRATVFLDVFTVVNDTTFQAVASADSTHQLSYEVEEDEIHTLRLQPELLQSITYELVVETRPSLAFPVAGQSSVAIGSFFGAPRDGGARSHRGVDIFAPKGTPVLAASAGVVSPRVHSNRGGKVVWLTTDRAHHYYAHLDSQAVRPLQRVQVGDTLGFVGNTGNARTTPPHLHFGVYYTGRGAIDPYPFLHEPTLETSDIQTDTSLLRQPARISSALANVRAAPTTQSPVVSTLEQYTWLHLRGSSGAWFRAELLGGQQGYVHQSLVQAAVQPISRVSIQGNDRFYTPTREILPLVSQLTQKSLPVLATSDSLLWVEVLPNVHLWLRSHEKTI